MNKGVSHATLGQFDKHGDEHSLQRISSAVIESCQEVSKPVRTDIPELRRPWFAENHDSITSPLFIEVSKNGVIFFIDDTNQSLVFYSQRPLPRKLFVISEGRADEYNVPFPPETINCTTAKWKEIVGLTFCDEERKLIVLDSALCSTRIISNVNRLWRRPKSSLQISRLEINRHDLNFTPFEIFMCLQNDSRFLITDPKAGCICLKIF